MTPIVVIPARMRSTRLPDKPLAEIAGVPMIVHVWRRAVAAGAGPVVVACAEPEIAAAVAAAGGRAQLTRPDHPSGSDRVFEAVEAIDPAGRYDVVVNLQADLPLIDPAAIRAALAPLEDVRVDIATLAAIIDNDDDRRAESVVKVAAAFTAGTRVARALYFSRRPVPWGEGCSITISASMPIAARRSRASWRSPKARSSSASGSSSSVRSKRACAST